MAKDSKSLNEESSFKSTVEKKIPVFPKLVIPFNRKFRNAFQHSGEKKAMEELKREEPAPKRRFTYAEAVGLPLAWLPRFTKLGQADNNEDQGEWVKLPLKLKNRSPFAAPEPQEKLESWKIRFGAAKKEQGTQTDFIGEPCPLCLREEAIRFYSIINREKPSVVDPARNNKYTKEIAIECPDRTYYSSEQLTFFCVGRLAYRGWTYETPDGRIEHMPRIPRGIPIDELRVDPPLRSPAPR